MRWHKFISAVLHPVVMPTIGVLLYYILTPLDTSKNQQYALLSIVFISTYIIPLLLLLLLKTLGFIKSFQLKTIEERKIPLFFMISLFFILGKVFFNSSVSTRDISYLFYGTSLALIIVYFIFFLNIKTSLHLISMGSAIGFFLVFQQIYPISILPIIALLTVLSGLLASSRLYLKAHKPNEVYLGFFIGIVSQLFTFWIL